MIMVYAVAAPLWLLACLVGLALLAFSRTRRLAAYVILIPTFCYWLPLLAAGAVLFTYQPVVESGAEPSRWVFAAIFTGSQALAGLVGLILGSRLAFRVSRARRVR